MKEEILKSVSMQDIIEKYNIKHKNKMFCCPFHGKDEHPSAKMYENTFYCFCCGIGGDIITFIEKYFNLTFLEALQKINLDFNLNLNTCSKIKINYQKIKMKQNRRYEKEKKEKLLLKKYCSLCDLKYAYQNLKEKFRKVKLNFQNWENITYMLSNISIKIYQIDNELCELDNVIERERERKI